MAVDAHNVLLSVETETTLSRGGSKGSRAIPDEVPELVVCALAAREGVDVQEIVWKGVLAR